MAEPLNCGEPMRLSVPARVGRKDGTLQYYRSLVTAFRKAGTNPLIDELDRVVTELERLAK